jgi:hypothetical protein
MSQVAPAPASISVGSSQLHLRQTQHMQQVVGIFREKK